MSKYFTDNDIKILTDILKKYETEFNSNISNEVIWEGIVKDYNSHGDIHVIRSSEELRKQWNTLKNTQAPPIDTFNLPSTSYSDSVNELTSSVEQLSITSDDLKEEITKLKNKIKAKEEEMKLNIKKALEPLEKELLNKENEYEKLGNIKDISENEIMDNNDQVYKDIIQKCNNSSILNRLHSIDLGNQCCQKTYKQYFGQCNEEACTGLAKYSALFHSFRIKASNFLNFKIRAEKNIVMSYFISNNDVAILNGHRYEAIARAKYMAKTKSNVIQCGKIVPPRNPWLIFEPDGLITTAESGISKLLEIKTPNNLRDTKDETLLNHSTLKKYLQKSSDGASLHLIPDTSYYYQIQFSLAILDLTECDLVIYSILKKKIKIVNVQRDDEYCVTMLNNAKREYFEKVIPTLCTTCNNVNN